MTGPLSLAAVLASGEPETLYSGLSLLVSSAADGETCAGLATFRALGLLLDPALRQRAEQPSATPPLTPAGRERFAVSLVELLDMSRELDGLSLYACAASVDTMGIDRADIDARLDGVLSMPRFLRQAADARLVFV